MQDRAPTAQDWPQRVPLKVLGRAGELQEGMIAAVIRAQLGLQEPEQGTAAVACKGSFVSYTFWVTLPGPEAEANLRHAFARLPGYLLQL